MHTALTIAGSDPSGGAGIQGDLKTFQAHGVYGMAVVTALTAQNTTGVSGVHDVPPEFVTKQLEAVLDDMPVGAVKTGMLSVAPTIDAVANVLAHRTIPFLVVDPVMVATSGDPLLEDEAIETIVARLFPLATIVTPNVPEAERLTDLRIESTADLRKAAAAIDAPAVLCKGGHLPGPEVVDVLRIQRVFHEFRAPRIDTEHTHGTGCAMAAAIAARLALGQDLPDAVRQAREFVRRALTRAVVLGKGKNPINHLEAAE